VQYPRRDADYFRRHLHLDADSRRRRRGKPAGSVRDHPGARGARCLGMVRPPRRHARPGELIVLAVDVEKELGTFKLAVRFEAAGGVTALFGPSGAGKTTVVNMIAGLVAPDRGSIVLGDK